LDDINKLSMSTFSHSMSIMAENAAGGLVYYGDIPVGAICCRFENLSSSSKERPPTLVILTLACVSSHVFVSTSLSISQYIIRPKLTYSLYRVLAPYRSQSLGTALLTSALRSTLHPQPPPPPLPSTEKPNTRAALTVAPPRKSVRRAMAHVQVGKEGAKRFYERLGFVAGETWVNRRILVQDVQN